ARARDAMSAIFELFRVVISQDLFHLQTVRPRINEAFLGSFEIILHVTLTAYEAAHLLPRSVAVHIVIVHALTGLERLDSFHETGTCHAQLHSLRIMTIDAGNRMCDQLSGLSEWHLVKLLEAFDQVAVAQFPKRNHYRGMTIQAGAWLFGSLLTFRVCLIIEHVGVTTFFTEISCESITSPHGLKPRIF